MFNLPIILSQIIIQQSLVTCLNLLNRVSINTGTASLGLTMIGLIYNERHN